jgi:hypothetical protein
MVVTEITIETNQVLVIKRKQVTRTRCSECASGAEFVPLDEVKVNVPVDETRIRQGVEALITPHFAGAADGSYRPSLRSWRGATSLARRFRNFLRRGANGKARPLD